MARKMNLFYIIVILINVVCYNLNMEKMKFVLKNSHIKILDTVFEMNKRNAYPNALGVKKILHGIVDNETNAYISIKSFSSLVSISGRKLCGNITNLIRHHYLIYIYNEKNDEMFLQITYLGEESIQKYKSKHTINYQNKQKATKISILQK